MRRRSRCRPYRDRNDRWLTLSARKPGPLSATRKYPSELTNRFALLSFREFTNARQVIVDRAGYREVAKQAIGRRQR